MTYWVNNIKTNQLQEGSIISGVEIIKMSTLIPDKERIIWKRKGTGLNLEGTTVSMRASKEMMMISKYVHIVDKRNTYSTDKSIKVYHHISPSLKSLKLNFYKA